MEENKKSGVKGVSWNKNTQKWIVKLANKYFGSFDNLDDAIKKRKEVEIQETPARFCVVCGKPIPPDRHKNAKTCSDECVRGKNRRYRVNDASCEDSVWKCEMCGEDLPANTKAHYCPRCQKKRRSEIVYSSYKKMEKIKRGEAPPKTCIICGNPIPDTRGHMAKTCSESCAKIRQKAICMEYYRKKHPDRKIKKRLTGGHARQLSINLQENIVEQLKKSLMIEIYQLVSMCAN